MNYSVVIATRNRLPALTLSVPRILSQSRPPAQLIVVDSSDDHKQVSDAINQMTAGSQVQTIIMQSERGLTLQRNIGLELVKHPVVFFPDDDSIFFPDAAKEIMETYERDTNNRISAVCAAESFRGPDDFTTSQATYKKMPGDRFKKQFQKRRSILEQHFFPDPRIVLGQSFFSKFPIDKIQEQSNVMPVEFMTGFRMSFRTDVVRRYRFDALLTRYALFEDVDASYKAWQFGAVVGARNAKIFHYRSPEKRGEGHWIGAMQLLNMAYIICANSLHGHPVRKLLSRYCRYKTFLYLVSAKDRYGRERYKGAKAALTEIPGLLRASPTELGSLYQLATDRCIQSKV